MARTLEQIYNEHVAEDTLRLGAVYAEKTVLKGATKTTGVHVNDTTEGYSLDGNLEQEFDETINQYDTQDPRGIALLKKPAPARLDDESVEANDYRIREGITGALGLR